MKKLVCRIEGERVVSLDSLGRRNLKNGQEIELTDDQINNKDIKFLLSKGILEYVKVSDLKKMNENQMSKVFVKCNLSPERKLTLDSIKGSVLGGDVIQVELKHLANNDIYMCIKNGILEVIKDKELIKEKETPKESSEKNDKKDTVKTNENEKFLEIEPVNNKYEIIETSSEHINHDILDTVTIGEVSESGKKSEQPDKRIDSSLTSIFKNIAKEVYKNKDLENEKKDESPKEEKIPKVKKPNVKKQTKSKTSKNIEEKPIEKTRVKRVKIEEKT